MPVGDGMLGEPHLQGAGEATPCELHQVGEAFS